MQSFVLSYTAPVVPTYSLSYSSDGGTLSGGSGAGDYAEGDVITLPDAFKSSHEFKGFTSDLWTGYLFSGDTFVMPSYDVVVSASFELEPVVLAVVNNTPYLAEFVVYPVGQVPTSGWSGHVLAPETFDVYDFDSNGDKFIYGDQYIVHYRIDMGPAVYTQSFIVSSSAPSVELT